MKKSGMLRRLTVSAVALLSMIGLGFVFAPSAFATDQLLAASVTRTDVNGVSVRVNVWLEAPNTSFSTQRRATMQVYCFRSGGPVIACRSITYLFAEVREKKDGASTYYQITHIQADNGICASSCPVSRNQRSTPWGNVVISPPPAPSDRQDQAGATAEVCPSTGNDCFNIQQGLAADTAYYPFP